MIGILPSSIVTALMGLVFDVRCSEWMTLSSGERVKQASVSCVLENPEKAIEAVRNAGLDDRLKIRIIPVGNFVTQDFVQNRVNIILKKNGTVEKVQVG